MVGRSVIIGMILLSITSFCWGQESEPCHRLGVGVHYWAAIDDIDTNNIDETGFGYLISYQYLLHSLFRLEGDLEVVPNGYAGSDETVISPQVMAIIGSGIYGGVGMGVHYTDGEFGDAPYYAFRVGFDMQLLPSVYFDLNANYRFDEWDSGDIKEDINTDTVTLGLTIRVGF